MFIYLFCLLQALVIILTVIRFQEIKNGESIKVYLEDILGDKPVIIDTATISSASFQLKNYSIKGIYRLRFGDDDEQSIFLYIDKNDDIRVRGKLTDTHQL